jgi:hypothetical protein
MTKLLSHKYKTHLAEQLQESVTETSNSAYYFFMGVHGDVTGDVPTPVDTAHELGEEAFRNMVQGKRVSNGDISLVCRKIPYVSNTAYTKYDDTDDELASKDYYVYVDEGAYFHVYKCLDNNFGLKSTVTPDYSYVSNSSNYTYRASDGYLWKYLYSVTDIQADVFTTDTYFPVMPNTEIRTAAAPGSVDHVNITQTNSDIPGGGRRYDNYVSGTFTSNQLRINGNNFLYAIANDDINYTDGFYTGCLIYIATGTGAGGYSTINNYFTNANGNFIVIEDEFTIAPTNGSEFEIYPEVNFYGSGEETINAVARALVNATGSNSVYRVEMIEKGQDYIYATANIAANSVVTSEANFELASIRPILPPTGGHGYHVAEELNVDAVEFTMTFANSESNTLLIENRFQQIGLLKDPRFANVNIELANNQGSFSNAETVYKISPIRLNSNVNVTENSNVITGSTYVLNSVGIVSEGSEGSYIPDDVLTINGGTYTLVGQVKVNSTMIREATINAAGSGYTEGTFSANLAVGTATTNATVNVTVNSTGFCTDVVITNAGEYTDNPPYLPNSAPDGGDGSGLTLDLNMGLENVTIYRIGSYVVLPTALSNNIPLANAGDGRGAELLIDFTETQKANFTDQFSAGDFVYFTTSDDTNQQLAVIGAVTNDTYMTITTNSTFSCSAADVYMPQMNTTAQVIGVANATHILLGNVDGLLSTNDLVVGSVSHAKSQINAISMNDKTKTLNSFIQLYKYDVNILSGTFDENEIVYQGGSLANSFANALMHSVVEETNFYMYTSNQNGMFVVSNNIVGSNSLSLASINNKYSPELEIDSGSILYLENIEPVERANNQAELLQIVLEF